MMNVEHPSFAKQPISIVPDSKPLSPVVHPQPSTSDSEYRIRLLSLYFAEIQQTGRIDYPDLVQFLGQVYEVENAPDGEQILPNHYDILLQNLQLAQADILRASNEIQILLNILAHELAHKNLTDELEEQVRSGIRQETQRFLKAAEYLLDTAQQHAIQVQFRFWRARSSPEEIDAEELRKRINDLKYIREYVAQHLRIRELIQEFVPAEGKIGNFHRVHKYLEFAPCAADLLGNCLQQTLQRKIAGDRKFVTPQSYR